MENITVKEIHYIEIQVLVSAYKKRENAKRKMQ